MVRAPQPVVVLLHGMFGRADDWRRCAEHLRRHWCVVVPELPVLSLPSNEVGIQALVQFVERMLEEQHIEQVVLAGNSLGGHVALSVALRNPHRIAALVLAGSSGLFEKGDQRNVPRRPTREWVRERIREVFFDEMHVTETLINEVHETVNDFRQALKLVRLAKSAKHENLRDLLHQIRCPVLLVWGSDDRITPPVIAHEFKQQIPHAELQFIDRCGHAPTIERPAEFNRITEEFLRRHFGYAYAGDTF